MRSSIRGRRGGGGGCCSTPTGQHRRDGSAHGRQGKQMSFPLPRDVTSLARIPKGRRERMDSEAREKRGRCEPRGAHKQQGSERSCDKRTSGVGGCSAPLPPLPSPPPSPSSSRPRARRLILCRAAAGFRQVAWPFSTQSQSGAARKPAKPHRTPAALSPCALPECAAIHRPAAAAPLRWSAAGRRTDGRQDRQAGRNASADDEHRGRRVA
jgi:hypothetical protein